MESKRAMSWHRPLKATASQGGSLLSRNENPEYARKRDKGAEPERQVKREGGKRKTAI